MSWPPPNHPLHGAFRRLRARKIAFLRSEPDPNSTLSTVEEMDMLFGGLPEHEDTDD
jgi:hypothetical protein